MLFHIASIEYCQGCQQLLTLFISETSLDFETQSPSTRLRERTGIQPILFVVCIPVNPEIARTVAMVESGFWHHAASRI